MTDKQIIIDDQKKTIHRLQQECTEKTNIIIALENKLTAKEQECEELRGDLYSTNEQLKDFKSHYDKVVEECENLREKYLGLKEQKGSCIVQLNTVNEQLNQLKSENDELKKIINEAKNSKLDLKSFLVSEAVQNEYEQQLDQLKAENDELRQFLAKEPLALQALQSGYADYKKRSEVFFEMINQYKQTLTEIKEIAENVIKNVSDRCIETTPMYYIHKQILQKISEVENADKT